MGYYGDTALFTPGEDVPGEAGPKKYQIDLLSYGRLYQAGKISGREHHIYSQDAFGPAFGLSDLPSQFLLFHARACYNPYAPLIGHRSCQGGRWIFLWPFLLGPGASGGPDALF